MNSKEALNNFIGTKSCMNCNHHEECDDFVECPCDKWERAIKQDLDRLEQLEKENKELKQLVKEQFEKIQRDSGKMASMDCELRRLKGEFIPQECEG